MIDEKALQSAMEATTTAGQRGNLRSAPVPRVVLEAAITAYLQALRPGSTGETDGLTPYAQGVTLLSLAREVGNGTRSYPGAYPRGHVLVGLGIAEYADQPVGGRAYWLRLTDAGRAMLAAAGGRE